MGKKYRCERTIDMEDLITAKEYFEKLSFILKDGQSYYHSLPTEKQEAVIDHIKKVHSEDTDA